MTRRIVTCLLLMLAFQFTWSAISAYCMHESGVAAQHLGHHQHKDSGHASPGDAQLADAGDSQQATKKKAAHSHCASCVHAVLAPAAMAPATFLMLAESAPVVTDIVFDSVIQLPPERPQWSSAS